jgi:threonine dehydrogenase-like Zn-dependent dehydrogenase
MRAAVLTKPKQFEIATIDRREPGPNEVLIRTEGCGVCGSNLTPWLGRDWFHYPFEPGAPGHEGWGLVEQVGEHVTTLLPGSRVTFLSSHAFGEFDVADENALVRLPEVLAEKPFPGEAIGCAFNVFRRSDIHPGQTVAVVGVGFLGAILVALTAAAGAHVVGIGRRPFALELARHYGARETILMEDHARVVERVKTITGGAGCDRVIEAAGAQWPLDLASDLARERGKLIIAGYHQDGPRQVNMQLWNWRGLDVINAHEREPAVYARGMREAVDAVATGAFDPTPLYTHKVPLDGVGDAFDAMQRREGEFMKALVML